MQERIHVENWRVSDLMPDPKNPRRNDAAVPAVKASIEQFGFRVPIVIDKDGNIIAGNTRYKAAIELGLEEVPCVMADHLTPKELKQLAVPGMQESVKDVTARNGEIVIEFTEGTRRVFDPQVSMWPF